MSIVTGVSDRQVVKHLSAHRWGEMATLLALAADRTSAMPPQAFGLAMDVPFISCRTCCVLRKHKCA